MPSVRGPGRSAAQTLATVLAVAAGMRVVGSVVAGFIALSQHRDEFDPVSQRAGSVLQAFGAAGDTLGALLLLAAAALIAWAEVRDLRLHIAIRALLLVTAVLVCLDLAGSFVIGADFNSAGSAIEESIVTGFGLAALSLCVGGWYVLGRIPVQTVVDDDAEPEPLVYALDRGNGEVFAFFSYAEITRTLSIYSLEEDEFDLFTDEGDVIEVSVVDERARFTVTGDNRRSELAAALQRFADKHDLDVDAEGDLTAYAVPISDWQWLELWPRWMRGVGRLANRLRR